LPPNSYPLRFRFQPHSALFAQANLAAWEFAGSLADINIPEATRRTLCDFYASSGARIRTVLAQVVSGKIEMSDETKGDAGALATAVSADVLSPAALVTGLHEFRGLEWRLSVTVASRLHPKAITPSLTLRLDTAPPRSAPAASLSAQSAAQQRLLSASCSAAVLHFTQESASEADSTSPAKSWAAAPSSTYFEADAASLRAALDAVELALAEAKTANMRRMMRYLH
jgi:hypothetical protein